MDKCKVSLSEKNFIYDKIFIIDDEELDTLELSKNNII